MIDLWRFPNFIFILLMLCFVSFKIAKKTNLIAGVASFYTFFSALFVYALSSVRYGQQFQFYMNTVAARAFMQSIVSVFFLYTIENTAILWALFELASYVNSLLMLFGYGITRILSFNATFAAITVPLIWFKPSSMKFPYSLIMFLPIAAIIKAGGSTPIFVCIAGFLGMAIASKRWNFVFPSIILPLIAGMFLERDQLLNSNERVERWKTFMSWWIDHNDKILGTGSGTFEWLGPIIERRDSNAYVFMHNEYLQILFEQGIVGLALFLIVFYVAARRSFKTPWLFASLCSVSVAMLTQFPLRFVITQLFVLLILRECLWKRSQF